MLDRRAAGVAASLSNLPLLPVPVVVAQHMPPTFTRLFADRVNRLTHYNVREADDGELLDGGSVYIAPGGLQTEVRRVSEGLIVRVFSSSISDSTRRRSTASSAAQRSPVRERLVAVIMTGMGDDGAQAIKRVRARGGRTIAESAETAIIFGCPNEAIKTGAVERVLPLGQIPDAIHGAAHRSGVGLTRYVRVARDPMPGARLRKNDGRITSREVPRAVQQGQGIHRGTAPREPATALSHRFLETEHTSGSSEEVLVCAPRSSSSPTRTAASAAFQGSGRRDKGLRQPLHRSRRANNTWPPLRSPATSSTPLSTSRRSSRSFRRSSST
jgi:hypothetical protein